METDELGIRQARQDFGALVNRTATRGMVTFITSHGRRVAGVVPLRIAETAAEQTEPPGDQIDLIALGTAMAASRADWALDDMLSVTAEAAWRLHRAGVRLTLDGNPITSSTLPDLEHKLMNRLNHEPDEGIEP